MDALPSLRAEQVAEVPGVQDPRWCRERGLARQKIGEPAYRRAVSRGAVEVLQAGGGGANGGGGATGDGYWLNPTEFADFKRKHPTMEPVVVKPGDSIVSVARAHDITSTKLAAANGISVDATLRPGTVLALPSRKPLARKTDSASGLATSVTGLMSPRNPYRHQVQNGYDFSIDEDGRTRRVRGELVDVAATRSRRNQAEAGGEDRLHSDEGGHYIAVRFNGPSDAFNHFAQNANFNRGAYRTLEERWARSRRDGHRIYVDIVPEYRGLSKRPFAIDVTWYESGKRHFKTFSNRKKGR